MYEILLIKFLDKITVIQNMHKKSFDYFTNRTVLCLGLQVFQVGQEGRKDRSNSVTQRILSGLLKQCVVFVRNLTSVTFDAYKVTWFLPWYNIAAKSMITHLIYSSNSGDVKVSFRKNKWQIYGFLIVTVDVNLLYFFSLQPFLINSITFFLYQVNLLKNLG